MNGVLRTVSAMTAPMSPSLSSTYSTYSAHFRLQTFRRQSQGQCWASGGGTCSVPGSSGPMSCRKIASPPIEMVSRDAP